MSMVRKGEIYPPILKSTVDAMRCCPDRGAHVLGTLPEFKVQAFESAGTRAKVARTKLPTMTALYLHLLDLIWLFCAVKLHANDGGSHQSKPPPLARYLIVTS